MPEYTIRRLAIDEPRPEFDCGDIDLNEFFSVNSVDSGRELLAVTYIVEQEDEVVAFFSLSNDAVKKEELGRSRFKKITDIIPFRKRYSTLPAVKIGRLATVAGRQSAGIGSDIMDYIKDWFTDGNKTGCRFIIVDAYNNPRAISFYKKNGFSFLFPNESKDKPETRLMIFDLITVRP
jgi:GNAT superfamily N-acetyltransferase